MSDQVPPTVEGEEPLHEYPKELADRDSIMSMLRESSRHSRSVQEDTSKLWRQQARSLNRFSHALEQFTAQTQTPGRRNLTQLFGLDKLPGAGLTSDKKSTELLGDIDKNSREQTHTLGDIYSLMRGDSAEQRKRDLQAGIVSYKLQDVLDHILKALNKLGVGGLGGLGGGLGDLFGGGGKKAKTVTAEAILEAEKKPGIFSRAVSGIGRAAGRIAERVPFIGRAAGAIGSAAGAVARAPSALFNMLPEAAQSTLGMVGRGASTAVGVGGKILGGTGRVIGGVGKALGGLAGSIATPLAGLGLYGSLSDLSETRGTSFMGDEQTGGIMGSRFANYLSSAANAAMLGGTAGAAVGGVGAIPGAIIGGISGLGAAAYTDFKPQIDAFSSKIIGTVHDGLGGMWKSISTVSDNIFDKIPMWVVSKIPTWSDIQSTLGRALTGDLFGNIATTIADTLTNASKWITDQFTWENLKALFTGKSAPPTPPKETPPPLFAPPPAAGAAGAPPSTPAPTSAAPPPSTPIPSTTGASQQLYGGAPASTYTNPFTGEPLAAVNIKPPAPITPTPAAPATPAATLITPTAVTTTLPATQIPPLSAAPISPAQLTTPAGPARTIIPSRLITPTPAAPGLITPAGPAQPRFGVTPAPTTAAPIITPAAPLPPAISTGGTYQPGVTVPRQLAPSEPGAGGVLGNLISRGEGTYTSFNRGTVGTGGNMDFSQMSVGEVMEQQRSGGLHAVGKYQTIPSTLAGAVQALGIDPSTKFTPELQEQIFRDYLVGQKRPEIKSYITGESADLTKASLGTAQEWAAVASPLTGRSYHEGVGGNRASISVQESQTALQQMRAQYAENLKTMSPEQAYAAVFNKPQPTTAAPAPTRVGATAPAQPITPTLVTPTAPIITTPTAPIIPAPAATLIPPPAAPISAQPIVPTPAQPIISAPTLATTTAAPIYETPAAPLITPPTEEPTAPAPAATLITPTPAIPVASSIIPPVTSAAPLTRPAPVPSIQMAAATPQAAMPSINRTEQFLARQPERPSSDLGKFLAERFAPGGGTTSIATAPTTPATTAETTEPAPTTREARTEQFLARGSKVDLGFQFPAEYTTAGDGGGGGGGGGDNTSGGEPTPSTGTGGQYIPGAGGGGKGGGGGGGTYVPSGDAVAQTTNILKGFEGYISAPKWDVNAMRAGYGSDTKTDPRTGQVSKITAGMSVSREEAEADLSRRITTEFMPKAANTIGREAWDKLTPQAQAAITSVTYNYGHVPSGVAAAAKSGDVQGIGKAISALSSDNSGVNAKRRQQEAQIAMTPSAPPTTPGTAQAAAPGTTPITTAQTTPPPGTTPPTIPTTPPTTPGAAQPITTQATTTGMPQPATPGAALTLTTPGPTPSAAPLNIPGQIPGAAQPQIPSPIPQPSPTVPGNLPSITTKAMPISTAQPPPSTTGTGGYSPVGGPTTGAIANIPSINTNVGTAIAQNPTEGDGTTALSSGTNAAMRDGSFTTRAELEPPAAMPMPAEPAPEPQRAAPSPAPVQTASAGSGINVDLDQIPMFISDNGLMYVNTHSVG